MAPASLVEGLGRMQADQRGIGRGAGGGARPALDLVGMAAFLDGQRLEHLGHRRQVEGAHPPGEVGIARRGLLLQRARQGEELVERAHGRGRFGLQQRHFRTPLLPCCSAAERECVSSVRRPVGGPRMTHRPADRLRQIKERPAHVH
jgi:hypothetical protein